MNTFRVRIREVQVYSDYVDLHLHAESAEAAAAIAIEAVEQRDRGDDQLFIEAAHNAAETGKDDAVYASTRSANQVSTRVYCTEILAPTEGDPYGPDGPLVGPKPEPLHLPGVKG